MNDYYITEVTIASGIRVETDFSRQDFTIRNDNTDECISIPRNEVGSLIDALKELLEATE